MKLYYHGQRAFGFGWGTCNTHLSRELGKLCDVECIDLAQPDEVDGALFTAVNNDDFSPACRARARKRFGYAFFEEPLAAIHAEAAKQYDVLFVGSKWNRELCEAVGIGNAVTLLQGVDHSVFKPAPSRPNDGRIRIFSGGKWEYRKGQDLVLDAFVALQDEHPELDLVTAWHNPWNPDWLDEVRSRLSSPKETRIELHLVDTPERMARVYQSTDFGVFPNRAEGGTNLVLMEYLACGKPVVMTIGTGHADVFDPFFCLDCRATADSVADGILRMLDRRNSWKSMSDAAAVDNCDFSWEGTARTALSAMRQHMA